MISSPSCCRLVGKVAADNSHKWVLRDTGNESDPNFISSWNMSMEPVRQVTQLHCFRVATVDASLSFNSSPSTFIYMKVYFLHCSNQRHGRFSSIPAFRSVFP